MFHKIKKLNIIFYKISVVDIPYTFWSDSTDNSMEFHKSIIFKIENLVDYYGLPLIQNNFYRDKII